MRLTNTYGGIASHCCGLACRSSFDNKNVHTQGYEPEHHTLHIYTRVSAHGWSHGFRFPSELYKEAALSADVSVVSPTPVRKEDRTPSCVEHQEASAISIGRDCDTCHVAFSSRSVHVLDMCSGCLPFAFEARTIDTRTIVVRVDCSRLRALFRQDRSLATTSLSGVDFGVTQRGSRV